MFADELKTFRRLGFRYVLLQILNFASVLASGLMMWKGLGLLTNTESPIVVVLSGSMEPAFYRGDLLFLTNPQNERYVNGDITVYKVPGADIPIVHRVLETHDVPVSKKKGVVAAVPLATKQLLLTKGDNNNIDDIELYQGLEYLERKHIVGKVRGFLPYVGYVTIAMNDFPQLKYALLGGAAQGYQDISFMPVIAEDERLHTLSMAIKCAVLAPAGPARSRTLGRLYKDERANTLPEYSILEKMFLDRLLTPEEVAKFAEGLATHQLARTSDGSTVLAKAVVEHNLRGASRLYNNIGFDALGSLLGLDGDKAEETTARMIEQGRLVGRIDQIERVIWFEGGEATGEKGSGRAEGVVGKELRRWDANVQGLAEEVEKVTSELQLVYPDFVAANLVV